jgi:HAMP domain-containing protein
VFGAVLLAIALSNQLAQPLLLLAEGVRQVARGDFSAKPVFASRDELGGLTASFAEMTQQLSEARELGPAAAPVPGRGRARANLADGSLDNLTAGVIVFVDAKAASRDRQPGGATRHRAGCRCRPFLAACAASTRVAGARGEFAQAVWQLLSSCTPASPEAGERDATGQDSVELTTGRLPTAAERESITLLVRGAARCRRERAADGLRRLQPSSSRRSAARPGA